METNIGLKKFRIVIGEQLEEGRKFMLLSEAKGHVTSDVIEVFVNTQ